MVSSDHPERKDVEGTTHPPTATDENKESSGTSGNATSSRPKVSFKTENAGPSASGPESDRPTEAQHDKSIAGGPDVSPSLPPVFDEIRYLQERLLYLEAQAIQASGSDLGNVTVQDSSGNEPSDSVQDDWEIRRRIRKASSAEKWVEKVEKEAEETVDERKEYGQGPNSIPQHQADIKHGGRGGNAPTMYLVREDGAMYHGDQVKAIYGQGGWYEQHRDKMPFFIGDDLTLRYSHKPHPRLGFRPRTSLQPIYRAGSDKNLTSQGNRPGKFSRRLGPPTEWDQSDSEEWSSDTSISSRDFNYFRSRLRGDFEWELDRLNAQVRRFRKHKAKKEAMRSALELAERSEKIKEAQGTQDIHDSSGERLGPQPERKNAHGRPVLNRVDGNMFQVARDAPKHLACVIDVLTGEPEVGINPWLEFRKPNESSTVDRAKKTGTLGHRTPAVEDTESKEDTGRTSNQSGHWTGQGSLPERIRINSKSIIESLSSIHGSEICDNSAESIVLLRPFRILHAYNNEIREMLTKLTEEMTAMNTSSAAEADGTAQAIPSDDRNIAMESSGEVLNTKKARSKEDQSKEVQSKEDQSEGAQSEASQPEAEPDNTHQKGDIMVKIEHLTCLQKFMDEYLVRKVAYLNSVSCSKIVFVDLWHLFQPGTLAVSADGKQAYQVVSIRSKRHKGTERWNPWDAFQYPGPEDSDSSTSSDKKHRHDITIKCVYIHFDGHSIGPVFRTYGFNKWDGEKDIVHLDMHPLRFHVLKRLKESPITSAPKLTISEEDVDRGVGSLRDRLIRRGQRFIKVAAVKQMYYSGLAVATRDEVASQVIVDFEAAFADDSRKYWAPKIRRLLGTDWDSDADKTFKRCKADCCRHESVHDDSYAETNGSRAFINTMMTKVQDTPHRLPSAIIFPRTLDDTSKDANGFTEEELMVMSYSAFGFVLRDRTWAELDLDYLSDVTSSGTIAEQAPADDDLDGGNYGAFGQLVLPPGHKKMVLSLISQHFRNKISPDMNDEQVDIVRGKGKGLIILLHGAPGVGKTTTAEGVAETFGKPLFQITCGDLGSSPKEVELALQTNFALANRWGCILLLDEADVFLAERRREDFDRNGMVAVFLRVLEYYAGILFLTTNRIGDFDEAFASRIHMSLYYPALDEISTMKVFRLNLRLIKSRLKDMIQIDEDEIISDAMKHWREQKDARWNGRQIRNACQTALALVENDAQPKGQKYNIKEKTTAKVHLTLAHLKIVSDSYLEFTNYLKAVHGADAEGRAKESGLRALDTLLEALKADKGKGRDDGSNQYSDRDQRRAGGNKSPLQSFTLRPASSSHQPNVGAPSTPEPAQPAPHAGWRPPQWSHDSPAFQAQRTQYTETPYSGHQQSFDDQRGGTPTTQPSAAGHHHLHTPQSYGSPVYGQRPSPSIHQTQGSQPYGGAYLDVASPPGPGGPSSQGPGPGYYTGGDQSGPGQRSSSSSFDQR